MESKTKNKRVREREREKEKGMEGMWRMKRLFKTIKPLFA